jgi:hypothetical protein
MPTPRKPEHHHVTITGWINVHKGDYEAMERLIRVRKFAFA